MNKSNFPGTNTAALINKAKDQHGKANETHNKPGSMIHRIAKTNEDGNAKVITQTDFACGGKEGILPDLHMSFSS